MAATHPHSAEQAEQRFTAAAPPEPDEPTGPPDSSFAIVALLVGLVVALLGVTGIVLLASAGEQNTGATAPSAAPSPTPAAATAAAPAPAARSIAVNLKEFTVTPQPGAGRAGRVTFHVRNTGAVEHEFVVLRTRKPAGALRKGSEADETGNVGEIGGLQPGSAKSLTLSLKPGHYALICNLPGHYLAGQHADFTVR